jgi:hypothetical protein
MPAMITPMMSTGDPFHLLGTALSRIARALAPPTAQSSMGEHRMTEVRGPFPEHLKGPHPPAGHGTAEPRLDSAGRSAVTWRSRAASREPHAPFRALTLNL